MNNHHEMPNGVEVMVSEKAVRKVAQIYTEHLMQPGNAEALISEALERIERKEKSTIDANEVRIVALERVAEDNGGVLPEGSLRDLYKQFVVESVIERMLEKKYDADDPECETAYLNTPAEMLLEYDLFSELFSDEINTIAGAILEDERLAL